MLRRMAFVATMLAVAWAGWAQSLSLTEPGAGPNPVAQMVADAIRASANAEVAVVAAGFFNTGTLEGNPTSDKLAKLLTFPGEEIYVLSLTGEQLVKGLERSLSLLPQPSRAFLQVSGLRVDYSAKAPANSRVKRVLVSGKPVETGRSYRVAMPATLARGALGYFTVWQKEQIVEQTQVTVEAALRKYLEGKTSWPLGEQERVVGD